MHLTGYGLRHPAQLDTPALLTGATPSAPTDFGTAVQRSVQLIASSMPRTGRHLSERAPSLLLRVITFGSPIKIAQWLPLVKGFFEIFSLASCKILFFALTKMPSGKVPKGGIFSGTFSVQPARSTIFWAHSPALAKSSPSGWLRARSKFSKLALALASSGCSSSIFSYRVRTP